MHSPNRELPRTQAKTSHHGRRPRNPQNLAICSDAISVTPPFFRDHAASRSAADAVTDGRRVYSKLRPSSHYP